MVKRFILLAIFVSGLCYAAQQEKIADFKEDSVPVLNNELRKLGKGIDDNASELGKVKADSSDSLGYLDTKVDNNTIAVNANNDLELKIPSQVQGDILYYNGSIWTRLGAGTSGQYLETQGAGANPVWGTVNTKELGNWVSESGDTVYQASTDGFVIAVGAYSTDSGNIEILSDASNPPTTVRAKAFVYNVNNFVTCITSPVKKNDYWEASKDSAGVVWDYVYWIPLQ